MGDYVVHQTHGIGKYLSHETIEISGIHQDYLTIQYQNNDTISIPVDQVDYSPNIQQEKNTTTQINKLNDNTETKRLILIINKSKIFQEDLIKLMQLVSEAWFCFFT